MLKLTQLSVALVLGLVLSLGLLTSSSFAQSAHPTTSQATHTTVTVTRRGPYYHHRFFHRRSFHRRFYHRHFFHHRFY